MCVAFASPHILLTNLVNTYCMHTYYKITLNSSGPIFCGLQVFFSRVVWICHLITISKIKFQNSLMMQIRGWGVPMKSTKIEPPHFLTIPQYLVYSKDDSDIYSTHFIRGLQLLEIYIGLPGWRPPHRAPVADRHVTTPHSWLSRCNKGRSLQCS